MPTQQPRAQPTSWWRILGWAAYLACSWTWCIGMFLPVLLVRDYGVWGFLVFAVPNVVGAGAMGWVLRNGASERIVTSHRLACLAFSLVTMAFHGFWLFWVLGSHIPSTGPVSPGIFGAGAVLLGIVAVLSLVSARARSGLWSAIAVWCISALAAVAFTVIRERFEVQGAPTNLALLPPSRSEAGLVWLAPVCAFGFALCPYLDLTFNRARQATSQSEAPAAYALGFGVLFLGMILFTLLYAPNVLSGYTYSVLAIANLAVVLQFISQAVFTVTVHAERVGAAAKRRSSGAWLSSLAIVIGILVGMETVADARAIARGATALSLGEVVYRCFMSFYGLVFPAYVWLCMIPTADGHSGLEGVLGRRKLAVFAAVCILAAPCYWMGFIERQEWWLAPGLAIVLLARLLVRGRPTSDPAPAQA